MVFKVTIRMDNAAFEDNPGELRRILENVGGGYVYFGDKSAETSPHTVFDVNGNNVGSWEIVEE